MDRIGLKEAIGALRSELSESILAAGDEELRFQVDDISMEFQVQVEKSAGGSGGIRFWVIELGGEASRASTVSHSLSLSLKPVMADGQPVLTGGGVIPD